MAHRIITLILLLLLAHSSAFAGLFDTAERSRFVAVDQAFRFDFKQNQHQLNLSWHIKEGYYLYRQKITMTATDASISDLSLPPGTLHQDEMFGDSEIYRQQLNLPVTLNWAAKGATLTVTYQGCAENGLCYPPESKIIPLTPPDTTTDSPLFPRYGRY